VYRAARQGEEVQQRPSVPQVQSLAALPGKRVWPAQQGEQHPAPAELMAGLQGQQAQQARPVLKVEPEVPVKQALKAGPRRSSRHVQQG